ncbi:MAG TPA: cysteine synthase family protein [Candidatus Bathyarchaeota archaeon]|nr:cysteine synthase family protein [Candidatus Bathyarchaeota archaeon]
MMEELEALSKLIGGTPLLRLRRIAPEGVEIYLKLEYTNPGGSHKDRVAYYMIRDAVEKGLLRRGDPVIEVSSGNTATAIAWIASRLGLRPMLILEPEVSEVREMALRLLGAETVRIESEEEQFRRAGEMAEEMGGVFLNQFENEANIKAHYETTGPEILEQMNRDIDAFVMGIGTGGTIIGVGRRLKEEIGSVRIIGVVPRGSALVHEEARYEDRIGGLSKVIKPRFYIENRHIVDQVIEVSQAMAIETVRRLAALEGLLVGPSTGAAVHAAIEVAEELGEGCRLVTIAADSLFRYPQLLKM